MSMKKSSKKFKTGLSAFAINNRVKAFAFVVFFAIANLLSLSSVLLVQSVQAASPDPNPVNVSPSDPGTTPINPGTLVNQFQGYTGVTGQLASLVEQVAEQEEQSDINIDNNLNTGLIAANSNSSSSSSTGGSTSTTTPSYVPGGISWLWQAIVGYTGQFLNTSPNTGKTTGLAGQVFEGMQAIFYYTVGGGWIPKLGWIFAEYTQEFVSDWIGPTIGNFLIARLIAFKDNPDVSYQPDTFSIQMRTLNHIVRDFSYDLLLLFFILGIWRYWTNSVWGNGNLWGAVGRIVTATATIVAWPEIYHYTILIGNLANDLFIQNLPPPDQLGADVVTFFYNVVAFPATEKTGLLIPFDWVLELVINLAIGLAMLVSLIVFFVEKAIQLTIVVMAYVFGPFFIVCICSPDTERYVSDFLKVFVEACAWNFIWGGLISILMYTIEEGMKTDSPIYMLTNNATIPVTSNPNNPWFVLLLMLGIMQAMLQVPGYISRGTLSAKPGILELGFAAYQAKRIIGGLYGTHGLYTQMRHALRDPNSHRWPLNLPKVNGANYAALQNQVGTGDKFGQKAFGGLGAGGAAGGAASGALSTSSTQSALSTGQSPALTPAQSAALTAGKSLTQQQMAGLTPRQRSALLSSLTPEQRAALAAGKDISLTPEQAAALNPAQMSSLASTQNSLTPQQKAALTPAQKAALTRSMTPAQAAALAAGKTISLTPEQSAALGLGQTPSLASIQPTSLTPQQKAALTPAQQAALARSMTPAQSAAMAAGKAITLTPEQTAALGLGQAPALAPIQPSSLTPQQLSAMTPAQISALTPAQLSGLTPAHTAALNPAQKDALAQAHAAAAQAQAAALAQGQAPGVPLRQDQSAALAAGQVFSLDRNQISALSPKQRGILSAAQSAALGHPSNTVALAPRQAELLSSGKVIMLQQDQIAAFTPEQTAGLVQAQNIALAPVTTNVPLISSAVPLIPSSLPSIPSNLIAGQSAAIAEPSTSASPVQISGVTGLSGGGSQSKIPMRAGLPLTGELRVTGKQTHTNLAAWLAQKVRLEGGVTFHEMDKHPGVGFSKTGITFDQIGGPDTFSVPVGASKEDRALALAATSFAGGGRDDRGAMDPGFEDAMLMANMQRSMRHGGPFNPWNGTNMLGGVNQKAMDRIALWFSDGRADDAWKTSMKVRSNRMQNKVIVEGVNAYMHGKSDGKNGIADYWTDKRGNFDAALQVYRLTDPSAKAGGVNQNALEVRSILGRANIELNGTTQTAAAHPLILALPSTEKPVAVHAMIRLLQSSAVSQYGEKATTMQRPALQTFYDGVMKNVGEDHVQAAAAIARNYGLNYVTPDNVNKVVSQQRVDFKDSLNKDDFSKSAQNAFGRLPPPPDSLYNNRVGRLLW